MAISKDLIESLNKQVLAENYFKTKFSTTISSIKGKCLKKDIPFELSWDDLDYPKLCPILGIELDYFATVVSDESPSIDRIEPELGYIPTNVGIISQKANRLKSSASLEEILAIADYIKNRQDTV